MPGAEKDYRTGQQDKNRLISGAGYSMDLSRWSASQLRPSRVPRSGFRAHLKDGIFIHRKYSPSNYRCTSEKVQDEDALCNHYHRRKITIRATCLVFVREQRNDVQSLGVLLLLEKE